MKQTNKFDSKITYINVKEKYYHWICFDKPFHILIIFDCFLSHLCQEAHFCYYVVDLASRD